MIESVAEQLKPSVGSVLNLPTPKAPKARTRKAKTTDKPAAKSKTRTSNNSIGKGIGDGRQVARQAFAGNLSSGKGNSCFVKNITVILPLNTSRST